MGGAHGRALGMGAVREKIGFLLGRYGAPLHL